ncbi:uncharacterized membrane-anchored protein YitT (DUF2179 family) [Pullulanibacillus pueri]|uniref:UPF0750 membrane protein YvjA n=1 Tax=Pullulanibacillus pueri TaxID=1437324 RepID=A0A8J3A0R4_9BACL|nr:YitT family protein [Pullulanibacillus pueri]MBM7684153.1 uncharacterized membrane-anchored protein YitT (DUF2179 family) [Pullulanibacillus pueri]GGH88881.1 UPF0750 membrane protein YvjA [Pullulanibacillus pueri]
MKRRQRVTDNKPMRLIIDYVYVLIGSALVAISFNLFLLPNKVASGGVSGISTILHWTIGIQPSYVQWALNIPLFIIGILLLGSSFGYFQYALKTLIGTVFLPFVVFLTSDWQAATMNPLLGGLFGGIGVGLGLGIVFRGNASTGGTDLVAQIVHKYTGISLGACVAIIDGLIVVSSAFALSLESALYALIGMYLTGKVIDVVQMGFSNSKMALIISNEQEILRQKILNEIDRGVTRLDARGGFTEDHRPILLCVVSQNEITKLKQMVKLIDPTAFVIVSNATEVLGEGFKNHR